jgi:hypothetical protein
MEVDVTSPTEQQGKAGILASLEQRAPVRRVPPGALRATCILFVAIAVPAAAFWLARHDSSSAVRPHEGASHVVLLESPAEPPAEVVAAIINDPAPPAPAHAGAPSRPQATTPAVRIPRLAKRVEAKQSATPEDSDVALLAALVAHGSADKAIVDRHSGASTASLLRRCHRLGGTEGELCEARICSGVASGEAPCGAR